MTFINRKSIEIRHLLSVRSVLKCKDKIQISVLVQILYYLLARCIAKESLLLSRGISLKGICKNVKFSNYDFAIISMIMNRHKCKLFKKILNDVQTDEIGEIHVITA